MSLYRFSLSLALVTAGWSSGAISHEVKQEFIPKGVTAKTGGYSPGQSHVSSMNNLRVASQLQSYPSHIAYVYLELHL